MANRVVSGPVIWDKSYPGSKSAERAGIYTKKKKKGFSGVLYLGILARRKRASISAPERCIVYHFVQFPSHVVHRAHVTENVVSIVYLLDLCPKILERTTAFRLSLSWTSVRRLEREREKVRNAPLKSRCVVYFTIAKHF